MSLINKMLQDLDARGTPGAQSFPSQIRPVARGHAGLAGRANPRTIAAASGGAAAILALAWFGWSWYQQPRAAARPAVASIARPAPAAIKPVQGMSSAISVAPADAAAPAPSAAPVAGASAFTSASVSAAAPVADAPAPVAVVAAAPASATRREDVFDAPAPAPKKHAAPQPAAPAAVAAPAQPKSVAGYEPDSEEARAARQAIMAELQARMSAGAVKPAAPRNAKADERREHKTALPAAAGAPGRQESSSQRAEGEYRRALASLQDGRMTETIAALEQALRLDPGHEAARQTLVGLLIEAKRGEEAIRHLQGGLALNLRQPALAMLLARLQIERGGSGIDTLVRTLPYAGNNADYHAFLAGALQRDQRYREAAEQYQAALRVAPGNGVWWMGLGMSLQGDKRNAEALEAFQRARASGTLSAELLAFVERRLQQLGR
jgi:MSHA biogenesis protein MshN